MRGFVLLAFLFLSLSVFAQESIDSTTLYLDQVIVKGYKTNRPIEDVPATINVINKRDLNRFGPTSLVTTVNTIPGVRMEERSPGSYRFSIRGSVMRSPFGIRNVKFYWKGMPFTDGGGNTYLNLLDMSTIGRMEIIKGPGSSLYGASTGGVVLLDSPPMNRDHLGLSVLAGSYGLRRAAVEWGGTLSEKSSLDIGFSKQSSDGYRQQSGLDRTNLRLNFDQAISNNGKLSFTYLYSNLAYETPGGLTEAQYDDDARQARPATKVTKGAVDQHAKIFNATHYFGTMYEHDWNEKWTTNIGAYGSLTDFKNPAILNYEHRNENNVGARTETQYTFADNKARLSFGAEAQMLVGPDRVYGNNSGERDTLQYDDRLKSKVFFAFAQAEYQLPFGFLITAGGSLNYLRYDIKRVYPQLKSNTRNFKPGFFPRLALIKKFGEQFSIYGSVSEGFSAPTLAEVLPSTSILNTTLNAEKGLSIETGIRAEFFEKKVKLNVAVYDFKLKQTIVVRTNDNSSDYFVNAGTTSQKGIESTISWTPWRSSDNRDIIRLWLSYTYNNYHFLDYVSGTTDLSGNRLTGVPPDVVVSGVDFNLKGWYFNSSLNYTDHIPVNDANTAFAHDYKALSLRAGKRISGGLLFDSAIDFFAGIDNALDQKYSLGSDLNAGSGRYFNLAPGRSFYGGINITIGPLNESKVPPISSDRSNQTRR